MEQLTKDVTLLMNRSAPRRLEGKWFQRISLKPKANISEATHLPIHKCMCMFGRNRARRVLETIEAQTDLRMPATAHNLNARRAQRTLDNGWSNQAMKLLPTGAQQLRTARTIAVTAATTHANRSLSQPTIHPHLPPVRSVPKTIVPHMQSGPIACIRVHVQTVARRFLVFKIHSCL